MTSFLRSNRPEIGLVDSFDLSEIYTQDERFALSNLLLDPDGLDQIFNLSSDGLTKEDVRVAGGLDKPVIHSLAISDEVLSAVSFDLSARVTADKAIGEPGKHSFTENSASDNLIVFSGGIAADKIEYNFLDQNGEVRTTTVPTSRESLFDSIRDNVGKYSTVFYQGLLRIRRRSHVNEIKLDSSALEPKGVVIESPSDLLGIPVYMRTANNTNPSVTLINSYATKNSPIILPVRIASTATISFSRNSATASSPPFVYGWELRRFSDNTLVRGRAVNTRGNVSTVNISINVSGTIGAGVNCLLYVYLDPEAIVSAKLSGIGLTEISGGQDIGLIGFNNLRELDISNNNLSTLPVWLKTLSGTLQKLNIRSNVYWNNGIVSFFDYQDLSGAGVTGADTSTSVPNTSLTQVLGYSGWGDTGQILAYQGNFSTIQDKSGRLYYQQRKNSIAGNTSLLPTVTNQNGFRPFTQLTELNLGSSITLVNPDFSKLFPKLTTLTIDSPTDSSPKRLWGLIPKLNNSGALMSVNLSGHRELIGGSIKYMGDTLEWDSSNPSWTSAKASQFIGQFPVTNFSVYRSEDDVAGDGYSGGICTDGSDALPAENVDGKPKYHHVTSGSAAAAWSGWLTDLQVISTRRNDIAFKIASGTSLFWNNLRSVDLSWAGNYGSLNKVEYNNGVTGEASTDILNAPQLNTLQCWRSGWWGRIFSISGALAMKSMQIGANTWNGYIGPNDEEFLLPTNFAPAPTPERFSELEALYVHGINSSNSKNLELRNSDFQNLPKLRIFYSTESYLTGKFPSIPSTTLTSGVVFSCWIRNCRFRDLKSLGTSISGRVQRIFAPLQGSGVGGSLLPSFAPLSTNTSLTYVNFKNSLSTRYPSSWGVEDVRNTVIVPLATGTTSSITPSVTWTSRNNNNTSNANSEKLYHNFPGTYFPSSEILVGDNVILGGNVIGQVTQIDRAHQFIYISSSVSLSAQTLTFRRRGQDISGDFNNHISLDSVYLKDCRLVGSLPPFENCTNLRILNLPDNILRNYTSGTFKNITGVSVNTTTPPRLRIVDLRNNAFTIEAIRRMISDLHDIAVYFTDKRIRLSIRVFLLGTKLNTTLGEYQNWTRSEIFYQTSTSGGGIEIPDPLETKFNQLGVGALYPGITIQLF